MHQPPRGVESTLKVWGEYPSLRTALMQCQSWERDAIRHGTGIVQLSFHSDRWVVRLSQDLIDKELPF